MKLILKARTPAVGFDHPLELSATYGQTLKVLLNNLNTYRSPSDQISQLYNQLGQEVPLDVPIRRDTTLYIN